jgi:hypothetical protein
MLGRMITTTRERARPTDEATGWRAAPPAPRLIQVMAYAVPLCVLPSSLWRIGHVVRWAIEGAGPCDTGGVGQATYLVLLSAVSFAAAYLTIGLVRPWGERFPRWIPGIGGREVPVHAATRVALTGASIVGSITVYAFTKDALGIAYDAPPPPPGCEPPGLEVALLYLPLPLWSPLLFIVAINYRRRRTR